MSDKFPEDDIYPPAKPVMELPNQVKMRGDRERLKELLCECSALNTHNVPKLCEAATRVWSYARSIAKEIGMDFRNPPIPSIPCSTVKNCPPNGEQAGRCTECPGKVGR